MGLNGPFGEHIRLSFQPAILVQHFQRTEQVIAAVIGKGQPVRPVIDKAVLGRKGIIAQLSCLSNYLGDHLVNGLLLCFHKHSLLDIVR